MIRLIEKTTNRLVLKYADVFFAQLLPGYEVRILPNFENGIFLIAITDFSLYSSFPITRNGKLIRNQWNVGSNKIIIAKEL